MYTPKPEWLRLRYHHSEESQQVEKLLKKLNLNTVCRQALCPNHAECFGRKTATFMILGIHCTRNCRFCNVSYAKPQPVDADEPQRIGEAVACLGLKYVVVTSVTRDDLPDGGASHFAAVIRSIREKSPDTVIEVLIPDLQGNLNALKSISEAVPDVISHNVETVPRLYDTVRPQANYLRSLSIIKNISIEGCSTRSKSGLMLGLGEKWEEVLSVLEDLRAVGCSFITLGQYLAPSFDHHPVVEYIHPDMFDKYAEAARTLGFEHVASGPLVRSSYHADQAVQPRSTKVCF